jgi:hypothetical protein
MGLLPEVIVWIDQQVPCPKFPQGNDLNVRNKMIGSVRRRQMVRLCIASHHPDARRARLAKAGHRHRCPADWPADDLHTSTRVRIVKTVEK